MHARAARTARNSDIAPLAARPAHLPDATGVFLDRQKPVLDVPLAWCGRVNCCGLGLDDACATSVCTDGSCGKVIVHLAVWVLAVGLQVAAIATTTGAAQVLFGVGIGLLAIAVIFMVLTGGFLSRAYQFPLWSSITLCTTLATLAVDAAGLGAIGAADVAMALALPLVVVVALLVAQFVCYFVADALYSVAVDRATLLQSTIDSSFV